MRKLLKLEEILKSKRSELIRIHHTLMKEYGWIPFEEFKKLPIPTVMNLLDEIQFEWREQAKQYRRLNPKRRK